MTIYMNRGQFEHYCNWVESNWTNLRTVEPEDPAPIQWVTHIGPKYPVSLERRGRGLYARTEDGTHYDLRWRGPAEKGRPVCTAKVRHGRSWQGRGHASGAASFGLFEAGVGHEFRDMMGIEVVYEDEFRDVHKPQPS